MKLRQISLFSSLVAASFTLVSCYSSKHKAASPSVEPANQAAGSSEENTHSAQRNSSLPLKTIYFDFDKYNIRKDQKEAANEIAEALKASSSHIQIQGNCDDRGSAEYNIALGERRAHSLKKYLVTSGVNRNSIETISYGKEHPVSEGENEESWSRNRRDDVVKVK